MITLLDIARQEADARASKAVASRIARNEAERETIRVEFQRRAFHRLYRDWIFRERGRRATERECDMALTEMIEAAREPTPPEAA